MVVTNSKYVALARSLLDFTYGHSAVLFYLLYESLQFISISQSLYNELIQQFVIRISIVYSAVKMNRKKFWWETELETSESVRPTTNILGLARKILKIAAEVEWALAVCRTGVHLLFIFLQLRTFRRD